MFDATAAAADLASLSELLQAAVDREDAYIAAARAFADSAAAYAGTFAAIEPATPGTGLVWDTSELATTGTLKVAPSAAPALTGVGLLPDGNFSLTLSGTLGQPYSVRATTDLGLGIWTVLTNGTIPVVPFVFEDLTATNYPQRFYRTSTP